VKNKYIDIISQTFDFPQEEFKVEDNCLLFNDIQLMDIIEEYGTPLKLSYLPKISAKIQQAKTLFQNAFYRFNYKGSYNYCYCTKSSHFSFILEEVIKNEVHIETSAGFDIDIVKKLNKKKKIDKDIFIICNGFKLPTYTQKICDLINLGFQNTIPILDNQSELSYYLKHAKKKFKLGIRIATDEKPNFEFYTSRLGFRYSNIVDFYKDSIKNNPFIEMKMLHFFINSGIQDTA
jgi:arginine decarboxylase